MLAAEGSYHVDGLQIVIEALSPGIEGATSPRAFAGRGRIAQQSG
ncbi:hypothetical protein BRAS3809_7100010 [Bradyrhizobium sp. STM 3809]|nr:hypothetical protein BRAS3809_7100010 [Bradyrhizobium sp. STM 3809]